MFTSRITIHPTLPSLNQTCFWNGVVCIIENPYPFLGNTSNENFSFVLNGSNYHMEISLIWKYFETFRFAARCFGICANFHSLKNTWNLSTRFQLEKIKKNSFFKVAICNRISFDEWGWLMIWHPWSFDILRKRFLVSKLQISYLNKVVTSSAALFP